MATLRDSLTYAPSELAFGTSGLRGLVRDMTDLECYLNTAGFLQFLKEEEKLEAANPIYLAGDLRYSTPRIMQAVTKAITDEGYAVVYCGLIPTPAVAYYAELREAPCIMVTGSHIPDDRNGIKFHKNNGAEVLKSDEVAIKTAVADVRQAVYARELHDSGFNEDGMLLESVEMPEQEYEAKRLYIERFTSVFDANLFAGKKIVLYQHSAVGRDIYEELFSALGAEVIPVGRSEKFIPIDTENVTPKDRDYFKRLAVEHPDMFAAISTDGDSDRPFVIDEFGVFNRGDVLGAVVADFLGADFAAYPVSASDAVDEHLATEGVEVVRTRIGSPYVVVAMQEALAKGRQRTTGWEVNGGFMLGNDFKVEGRTLAALATRDAALPIICALAAAVQADTTVSKVFAKLPQRFTQAGLIDNFPVETSKAIVAKFSQDTPEVGEKLGHYFSADRKFGKVTKIDATDGVRIFFDNNEVAHLRPSGNAPQLRCYSVADSQARADEIVAMAIEEPNGIFRAIEKDLR
jgi:phosphomannomutase